MTAPKFGQVLGVIRPFGAKLTVTEGQPRFAMAVEFRSSKKKVPGQVSPDACPTVPIVAVWLHVRDWKSMMASDGQRTHVFVARLATWPLWQNTHWPA